MKPTTTLITINSALAIFIPALIVPWLIQIEWRDSLLIAFLAYYLINLGSDRILIIENMKATAHLAGLLRDSTDEVRSLLESTYGIEEKEESHR